MAAIKVAIIEPSPALGKGIKALLKEQRPGHYEIANPYRDLASFMNDSLSDLDIILFNPALVTPFHSFDVRELFSDYDDTLLVAIPLGNVNHDTFIGFDGVLNVFSDGPQMHRYLNRLLKQTYEIVRKGEGISDSTKLTKQEIRVLSLIAQGKTNNYIAEKLGLSPHTVTDYRKRITTKTRVKGIAAMTIYAIENNLVGSE